MKKASNEFEPFLNECQTYVWEWYIPEHKVRFGIPSLNRLWTDDKEKNIKLATMLERVHPDDIQKVLVKKTSPLYRSDKMFEVDLRLNVADELMPDGAQASGEYEWYGFRGKTIRRDAKGQPTYVRGVAINLDQRYRAQMKLIAYKEHQLQSARHQNEYCVGVMQEVYAFMHGLAENANSLMASDTSHSEREMKLNELKVQAERILSHTDKYRDFLTDKPTGEENEIKPIFIWEHMAELQQVYSLKASMLKIYFSNLYDNHEVYVNDKLLDVLIDNIINVDQRNKVGGCVTMSYSCQEEQNLLKLNISFTNALAESGLGLSVCRILAKRLWGDVTMRRKEDGRVEYIVTLPVDARRQIDAAVDESETDTLDELDETQEPNGPVSRQSLPRVLIGVPEGGDLYENQHLFDAVICDTTDKMQQRLSDDHPDMVFVDSRLQGTVHLDQLIGAIHAQYDDLPIIVTDDEARRPLHKHLRQLGAQYLLTNPLTQRKVNMMIRRYLK